MNVRVDETGKKRDIAEIEELRGSGMLDAGTDFNDAVALNKHLAGGNDFAGFDVEQPRGVENDGLGSVRLRQDRGSKREHERRKEKLPGKAFAHAVNDSSST